MRALVLPGKNEPLEIQERPSLRADQGEAIVKVYAAALNHRDLWIQKGQYAGLKYPITPGSDAAGIVVDVNLPGEQQLTGALEANQPRDWIGREVIINPSLNWGGWPSHQDQETFRILGLPHDGTLAEYVKVPLTNLADKPAHLTFEEAAAIPLAGATAYRALFTRAQLGFWAHPNQRENHAGGGGGEKVLITGIGGGVALFALQYAIASGARAYVTSGSDEKISKAIAMGAIGGVNYRNANWMENLRDLAGSFDITIDGAGGDGINALLNLASPGGRLVFYGATLGNPSALEVRRIFWKQLNMLGSTMANPADFSNMIAFINKHELRPVVDKVFPFTEGEAALRRMDNAEQFGKIVIKII